MAEQRIDASQIAGTIDWLEDDHRQLRARVGHLEQEVEQLAESGRDLTLHQRTDAADIEAIRQQMTRVPHLEEAVRQAQEDVGDLRALMAQQASSLERTERSLALEMERLRIQLSELGQRLTVLAEEVQPLPVRIQSLSDHARRLQDQMTALQLQSDQLTSQQSILQSKIDLSLEQAHRLEQSLASLANEFAPLRREDEVLGSRVQLAMDLARQIEQKMAEILAEEQARRELAERVDILRAERQRIQAQLGDLEHASATVLDRADELSRLLRQEADRRHALTERIAELEGRLLDTRQAASESIIQVWQTVEEQKRSDITHFQDQAKALRDTLQRLTRPQLTEE